MKDLDKASQMELGCGDIFLFDDWLSDLSLDKGNVWPFAR